MEIDTRPDHGEESHGESEPNQRMFSATHQTNNWPSLTQVTRQSQELVTFNSGMFCYLPDQEIDSKLSPGPPEEMLL